jgi:two-component system, OmpR family, sensor histidine kinase SenX3
MALEISFSDLIASSIHDMKNSLNIQINDLEKMAAVRLASGDTQLFEDMGRMIYQANRMNGNLIQLLSLYKLGKAIYPTEFAEHNIAELIDEVMLQNSHIMKYKGIKVTVDCDPDCYWHIDRDLVAGVLINAVNNAYNYTGDQIRVAAGINGDFLEIRVEDNGRGYPQGMLQKDNVSASGGSNFLSGSTGLGFYFSSQVAQLHHNGDKRGSLTIENGGAFGGGCFVVKLP